jgi:cytochrome P450
MTTDTPERSDVRGTAARDDARDVASLPLVPRNPLPYRELLKAVRNLDSGQEVVRRGGGPITRIAMGPAWLVPPLVSVMSPDGVRDVLGRNDAFSERCIVHDEVRALGGDSLFVLPNEQWRPRKRALAPVFTKVNVRSYSGHMARAADDLVEQCRAGGAAGVDLDLDVACRRLTMQSLGRSVLGIDLNERADEIAVHMHVASSYTADRALRPFRAPRWLPTPYRRRARHAVTEMRKITAEILAACRADPTVDAPLVHALIAAVDPETGQPLSDDDIGNDLLIFMLAGHDTTATALTYALWALGHHPEVADRVAAEAAALGDHQLTAADAQHLGYTMQVLRESLRLCPPAAGVGRLAVRDIDVAGYRVEKGTLIAVGIYALHRDPELWPDPTRFDPDRFTPEQMKARQRWQFVPFAGGARSCIGEHFAMLETTLALATIARAMTLRSRSADFPVEVPFTTVAKGPIWARLEPRQPPAAD